MLEKIITADNSKTTIILRLLVGPVFFSLGTQKFLFPDIRGAGRFEKIGFPSPEIWRSFVFEILHGILLLVGLLIRLASILLIRLMPVAVATTKAEVGAKVGFWKRLYGCGPDGAMLLGSIFLLLKGGGNWSIDKILMRNGA